MKQFYLESLATKPKFKQAMEAYLVNPNYWFEKLSSYTPRNSLTQRVWKRSVAMFNEYVNSEKRMSEIAENFKMSPERVSQITEKMLRLILLFQRKQI